MNRVEAARLVEKLRVVTTDRGATIPEARVAAEKAAVLVARYKLIDAPSPPPPRSRPQTRAAPAAGFPGWVGGQTARVWAFDMKTGRGSNNVKVHRYDNPSNWRIEIDV